MTARPMTETCPKLREAIENGHLRCSVSVGVGSPVATIDTEDLWRLVHAAERSLSTSAAVRGMREALESIWQYGSDTLSGRADGGPDDRQWQRDAVLEMTRRASAALSPKGEGK